MFRKFTNSGSDSNSNSDPDAYTNSNAAANVELTRCRHLGVKHSSHIATWQLGQGKCRQRSGPDHDSKSGS